MTDQSYAQLRQDLDVVSFYHNKKGGYFVDVGANDGVTLSNTYLLEHKYEWTGLCIEPLPLEYHRLVINRPHSTCINRAVFSQSNLLLPFTLSGLFSGLIDCLDRHRDRVLFRNTKISPMTIQVTTTTLNDLLKQNDAPHFIEYLSVDTEGSELETLKSIDLKTYTFGLIHIEHNFVEPRRTLMRTLLETNGYQYLRDNQWDDIYTLKQPIV
jgi:FkbM family methyltransferase